MLNENIHVCTWYIKAHCDHTIRYTFREVNIDIDQYKIGLKEEFSSGSCVGGLYAFHARLVHM